MFNQTIKLAAEMFLGSDIALTEHGTGYAIHTSSRVPHERLEELRDLLLDDPYVASFFVAPYEHRPTGLYKIRKSIVLNILTAKTGLELDSAELFKTARAYLDIDEMAYNGIELVMRLARPPSAGQVLSLIEALKTWPHVTDVKIAEETFI